MKEVGSVLKDLSDKTESGMAHCCFSILTDRWAKRSFKCYSSWCRYGPWRAEKSVCLRKRVAKAVLELLSSWFRWKEKKGKQLLFHDITIKKTRLTDAIAEHKKNLVDTKNSLPKESSQFQLVLSSLNQLIEMLDKALTRSQPTKPALVPAQVSC